MSTSFLEVDFTGFLIVLAVVFAFFYLFGSEKPNTKCKKVSSSFVKKQHSEDSPMVMSPTNTLPTEWVWYWKNDLEQWIEYGTNDGKTKSAVTSAELETLYLADRKAVVPFQAGSEKYEVHFQDMTQKNLLHATKREVCRRPRSISPEVAASSRCENIDLEWVWYWKNEHGQWIEYGKHGVKEKATLTSADLEKKYQADNTAVVSFKAGDQNYELNFQDMCQNNVLYGTKKEVRRSQRMASNVNTTKRTLIPTLTIPSYWDQTELPDVGYQLVNVDDGSAEFKGVQRDFKKTMPTYSINKMKRIQNPFLWKLYQCQMEQMNKVNEGNQVLEKKLFHGTDTAHVEAICRDNFDWRICGTHGTLYGKGSYFARDAGYSHNYCNSSSSSKTMFVARVLVGDFVVGNSDYLRPPPKPSTQNNLYDSCVNDKLDPSIFVIFEKTQIYPEYILEYSKTNPLTLVKESTCCIS